MKSKGFTLVELLAVIAIMALLITLAVPSIIKLYNDAKKNAFKVEAESIIKAAEEGYAVSILSKDVEETTYTYTDGSESKTGNINMYISGNKPDNGEVKINTEGQVSIALHNGEYCATKNYVSKEVTIESSTLEECVTQVQTTPESCFITDLSLAPAMIQYYYNTLVPTMTQEELNSYGIISLSGLQSNETRIYYYDYENSNCPSDVVIPGTINEKTVIAIGMGAFSVPTEEESVGMGITSVVLPNSIKYIESSAFTENLITTLTLPNSLTMIGDSAFRSNSITSVNIPNSVISIKHAAFHNNQLGSIIIPNSVTNIGDFAFAYNQITSATLPTNMISINEGIFASNQLTSITIPNGVTTIGDSAFASNQLTSITIPSGVTYLSGFRNNQISSINIPTSVTTIGDRAFEENQLTSVIIPNGVTSIGRNAFMFNHLTSVTIPNSVITIDVQAFYDNNLTNVTIPNNVTSIGTNAFRFNSLTSIAIPTSVTTIGDRAFEYNYIPQGSATINNTASAVTVASDAFDYNGTNQNTTITPVFLWD